MCVLFMAQYSSFAVKTKLLIAFLTFYGALHKYLDQK